MTTVTKLIDTAEIYRRSYLRYITGNEAVEALRNIGVNIAAPLGIMSDILYTLFEMQKFESIKHNYQNIANNIGRYARYSEKELRALAATEGYYSTSINGNCKNINDRYIPYPILLIGVSSRDKNTLAILLEYLVPLAVTKEKYQKALCYDPNIMVSCHSYFALAIENLTVYPSIQLINLYTQAVHISRKKGLTAGESFLRFYGYYRSLSIVNRSAMYNFSEITAPYNRLSNSLPLVERLQQIIKQNKEVILMTFTNVIIHHLPLSNYRDDEVVSALTNNDSQLWIPLKDPDTTGIQLVLENSRNAIDTIFSHAIQYIIQRKVDLFTGYLLTIVTALERVIDLSNPLINWETISRIIIILDGLLLQKIDYPRLRTELSKKRLLLQEEILYSMQLSPDLANEVTRYYL